MLSKINIFILLVFYFLYQSIAFADCSDIIKVPLNESLKKELKDILSKDGTSFTEEYLSPFNVCKDKLTLILHNGVDEVSITSGNDRRKSSVIFIVDNSQENDSRYKFYLEVDNKKYPIKNSHEITLSMGSKCSGDSNFYTNWVYVDLYGYKKFSHGHCPTSNQDQKFFRYESNLGYGLNLK
jgi:hypothetical protein